jgi:DNA invertase Pin-like site-specific DNA recombinase
MQSMIKPKKNYVAYLRQSTIKQQVSGIGIEAQQEIIRSYVQDSSGIYRDRDR